MKKVILITGASSGMGKQTAADLLKSDKYIVYCAARSVDKMKDLEELGGHILNMDMTNDASMQHGVEQIIKKNGRIDVLWNNAGYGLYGPVEEVDIQQARAQFEVNIFGLARLTQLVLPHMRNQKNGLIINTSSMGGKVYLPLGAWYHATKHALEGWSDCLRLEVQEFGIKVVILEPGLINTGFGAGVEQHFPAEAENGPYARTIAGLRKFAEKGFSQGSSPQVISDTVQKIINAKKPKTRYLVGKMAKPLVFMRTYLGDRVFDWLIMKRFS